MNSSTSSSRLTSAIQDAPAEANGFAPLELVRRLVAARAELPVASIRDENRMLSDLHLNSITVGQLVSEAAKQLGLPRLVGLTEFANASIAEMAQALEELQRTGGKAQNEDSRRVPAGVDTWIRSFVLEQVETKRPQPRRVARDGELETWQVFAPPGNELATALQSKLATAGGGGVVVCLPEKPEPEHFGLLLAAARAVTDTAKKQRRFVLVQHGWGGAGFARTLHQETPGLTTCVVNVPSSHRQSAEWVLAEALAATGYSEAYYDQHGRRWVPRLKLNSSASSSPSLEEELFSRTRTRTKDEEEFPLGTDDVLLVTGGGKGIAAECALALARATGARLAVLGRSKPEADKALAENLARFAAAGVRSCYVSADVTDESAVRAAVVELEQKLGPITGLLHGAGTNAPQLIGALDEAAFRRTLAPKLSGVRNVLAALDAARLKMFVTFSSIIARIGLRGEADYATANEWLTAFTEEFQAAHPQCRCLALEWSVWSGVGMGERLGRIEVLAEHGITPIPIEEGVAMLLELLRRRQQKVAIVIAGHFGQPATVKLAGAELPSRRFLDRKRAYYPGVELIVEAELSADNDPYLNDHALHKQKLFPAVMGLEAMAQAAMALTGANLPPRFEKVELSRPVSVSDKSTVIRVAALRRAPDLVEVCLRSEETDFQVDHFRALCRLGRAGESDTSRLALSPTRRESLSLDPHKDLYGRILFHEGRFCRLRGYRLLKARECVAEIAPDTGGPWFGPYLPAEFVLGDPAARDATLHAIQACIPHRRILPTGIDELVILRTEPGVRFVRAKERARDGNNFIYDLEVTDGGGSVVERWTGLHLRAVEELNGHEFWPDALLAPYLERRLEELAGHANLAVAFERGEHERVPGASDEAIHQALGRTERIWRRPDGKPVMLETGGISAAHCQDLMMAVAGAGGVACDLEEVMARSMATWRGLLREPRFKLAELIAHECSEGADTAATRVWAAAECLKKIGLPAEAPLVLDSITPDCWVLLRSGRVAIATCAAAVGAAAPVLVAALAFKGGVTAEQERAGVVMG